VVRVFKYAVIRLAVFFVVWGACMLLGLGWVFSTIAAAVIALAAGYLFFNDLRRGAGVDVASAWEGRGKTERFKSEQADMDVEDAYTEGRYLDPHATPAEHPTETTESSPQAEPQPKPGETPGEAPQGKTPGN
jgi:hypothetical protein